MKILYDSQCFQMQKFGGISRYFYKLVSNTNNLFEYKLSGIYLDNIYATEISPNKCKLGVNNNSNIKNRIISISNKLSDCYTIKSEKYDVFHPTYYEPACLPRNKKVVITAHDFIHELFPQYFTFDTRTVQKKNKILHSVNHIIAISECTKSDLLKLYPDIPEDKISVIYHSNEWSPNENHKLDIPINKPYILYTGARYSYKNFEMLIKSISSLLIENDFILVCTGSNFNETEKSMFQSLNIEKHVVQYFADDNQLKALYENALCFVFPSMYEGFGFPILEAFASRCPIVLSNTSCFPEIAGDAGIYFDPYSELDIKNKIETVVFSESLRKNMIIKGVNRLSFFDTNKMISQTCDVYKQLVR